tara:strand:+ start:494 stop:721 length:228 start_codon:yes stop_codon:yes gene_type:complete
VVYTFYLKEIINNFLIMKYIIGLINLIISLVVSTIIIYSINIFAGIAGADYSFTHGEIFAIWILMAILVNNCFNK